MNLDSKKYYLAVGKGSLVAIDYEGRLHYSKKIIEKNNNIDDVSILYNLYNKVSSVLLYIGEVDSPPNDTFQNETINEIKKEITYHENIYITLYELLRYRTKFRDFLLDETLKKNITSH